MISHIRYLQVIALILIGNYNVVYHRALAFDTINEKTLIMKQNMSACQGTIVAV